MASENRFARLRTPRTYCFNSGFSGLPNRVTPQSGCAASGAAHNSGVTLLAIELTGPGSVGDQTQTLQRGRIPPISGPIRHQSLDRKYRSHAERRAQRHQGNSDYSLPHPVTTECDTRLTPAQSFSISGPRPKAQSQAERRVGLCGDATRAPTQGPGFRERERSSAPGPGILAQKR